MTAEKLRRVIWRLEEQHTPRIPTEELHKAIMLEIGTSKRTIHDNVLALIKIGWIKRINRWYVELTGTHE